MFVLINDNREGKTHLSAINPMTGLSESFCSWTVDEEESRLVL